MLFESIWMITLETDVVHRDNFRYIHAIMPAFHGEDVKLIVETANMHPKENIKILASHDSRMVGYKRVQTIRKDMTYLLIYERES